MRSPISLSKVSATAICAGSPRWHAGPTLAMVASAPADRSLTRGVARGKPRCGAPETVRARQGCPMIRRIVVTLARNAGRAALLPGLRAGLPALLAAVLLAGCGLKKKDDIVPEKRLQELYDHPQDL